jgi:hypothetical protein
VRLPVSPPFAALVAVLIGLAPLPAAGQAFTPPAQVGSVTFAWQWVSNTGHFLTDGALFPRGESVTSSMLVEVDYGVTHRFSTTLGLPYVFAKYTGDLPPFSQLERDACKCWHSSFQDVSVGGRYRFGDDFWAITPSVKYGVPTHGYPYEGEAVVGRRLKELQFSANAAIRLVSILPKTSVTLGYTYSIPEEPLEDLSLNRSNTFVSVGYPLTRSLFVYGNANWQLTHGGVLGSDLGTTPETFAQRDRVLKTKYWHAGGGVSYSTGTVDIFGAIEKYINGRDAHNGIAYTIGSTWYFDFSRTSP